MSRRVRSIVCLVVAVSLVAVACGSDESGIATSAAVDTSSDVALLDEPTATVSATAPPTTEPVADQGASDDTPEDGDAATTDPATPAPTPTAVLPPGTIEILQPEVIETYPHDNTAFTQGLEVLDGFLLESTGRQGHPGGDEIYESDLRRVEIDTGNVVLRADAPGQVFAEGLTRVGDELIQLTWQDGVAFWWDAETFAFIRSVQYDGQGWGLCYDGERLIMSDGSSNLFFRDPVTFDLIGQIAVTQSGAELPRINELECVDGKVWANVWQSDFVVRIDPETGLVDGIVDASTLEQPRTPPTEVLNGIAWDAETSTWLMTGKFWSTMYRVRFVAVGTGG